MRLPPPPTEAAAAALLSRMAEKPWHVLSSPPLDGASNMEIDTSLLESAAAGGDPATLRFYSWSPPAVSLGRFQGPEGIDLEYLRRRGWDLVRRPTGGRAVLHHLELTYSIALPPRVLGSAGVRTSYDVLSGLINAGVRGLLRDTAVTPGGHAQGCATRTRGEPNCFALAAECDGVVEGAKLIGSAQVRRGGALLQHGSILLDAERDAWTALFGTPGALTTLRSLLGQAPAPERVAGAVAAAFEAAGVRLERAAAPTRSSLYTPRSSTP